MNKIDYHIGYSTDETVRHRASSGGIGTALTKYLLSTDEYGTSITFEFDTDEIKYKPVLIHSSDDVKIKGSIYHDVDIARFVKQNITNIKGGLVVTCPPCQVSAIKQICKKNEIKAFIISYCCSGQTTIEGTWKYYELLGIDKNDVVDMQYRGNGWPSGIQIRLKDGREIYKDNYEEPWKTLHKSWLYRPNKCFFCKRDTGRNADISLADPWLDKYKENDNVGNTLFVVLSDNGRNVIDNMNSLGLIKYVESDYNEYSIAQQPNIHKEIMVLEHMTYLKRINNIISNKYYHKWATSSLSNIKRHLAIMSIIRRTESVKSIIISFMNLLNKIRGRIRRIYYSKVMNTNGTNFSMGEGDC